MNRHGFERLNAEREAPGAAQVRQSSQRGGGFLPSAGAAITASRPLDYYIYGLLVEGDSPSRQPLGNPGAA